MSVHSTVALASAANRIEVDERLDEVANHLLYLASDFAHQKICDSKRLGSWHSRISLPFPASALAEPVAHLFPGSALPEPVAQLFLASALAEPVPLPR